MNLLEQLTSAAIDGFAAGDPLYDLDEIKEKYAEVIELRDSCWLALAVELPFDNSNPKNLNDCSLQFALFHFAYSDDSNTKVTLVFQGGGPTSSLREMRHIWWGPDGKGYTFYLPVPGVIKAFEHLKKYYDF